MLPASAQPPDRCFAFARPEFPTRSAAPPPPAPGRPRLATDTPTWPADRLPRDSPTNLRGGNTGAVHRLGGVAATHRERQPARPRYGVLSHLLGSLLPSQSGASTPPKPPVSRPSPAGRPSDAASLRASF